MLNTLKILKHQRNQFIKDLTKVILNEPFRGRPVISNKAVDENQLVNVCPVGAISPNPVQIDLGKCTFCNECVIKFPDKIKFITDYKISTNDPSSLIIKEGVDKTIELNPDLIRKEISLFFNDSLKLRQ